MRVILQDNVPTLGQKDDIKEVKRGYWRNFLLPRGLAVEATPALVEQVLKKKEAREKAKVVAQAKLAKILKGLTGKTLIIKTKADEKGSLFAGIDAEDIAKEIKEQYAVDIPKGIVKLEKPIKEIGLHEVTIGEGVLKVDIVADKE
jgi:large subunit ribosomal protein L9